MAKRQKSRSDPAATVVGTETVRRLFLAGLGLVHVIAAVSLWVQLDGLVGPEGISPWESWLMLVDEALIDQGKMPPPELTSGWLAFLGDGVTRAFVRLSVAPTLAWFLPAEIAGDTLCLMGIVAGLLLMAGRFTAPAALLGWASYLSLAVMSQQFLLFQWDSLLIEASFAAVLLGWWRWHPRYRAPPAAWWVQRWLLVRLVFFGGFVKLTSGDPTWRDLSAMTYHYATQPLPNPLSPWFHALPAWWHGIEVVGMFVMELVLIWAALGPRRVRPVAFGAVVLLMGALALTGNYGFFQIHVVLLALCLLDDGHLHDLTRGWVDAAPLPRLPSGGRLATSALASALIGLSILQIPPRYFDRPLPDAAQKLAGSLRPWRTVNTYGLFAVMTTSRPIPVLEARWDDGAWTELTWQNQTSDPAAWPNQVAPHMPRLDWQLWFAGLGGCKHHPWVAKLQERVLEGSEPVADLIGDLRLRTSRPPDAVRTTLYRYELQEPGADRVWSRERVGGFCSAMRKAE